MEKHWKKTKTNGIKDKEKEEEEDEAKDARENVIIETVVLKRIEMAQLSIYGFWMIFFPLNGHQQDWMCGMPFSLINNGPKCWCPLVRSTHC